MLESHQYYLQHIEKGTMMVAPGFYHRRLDDEYDEEFAGQEERHDLSCEVVAGDAEACGICMDRPATEELRLRCIHKHKFCTLCIDNSIEFGWTHCAYCKTEFGTNETNETNETNGTQAIEAQHMTLAEEARGGRSDMTRAYFLHVVAYLTLFLISFFLWTSILVAWHALVHGVDVSSITVDWRQMAIIVSRPCPAQILTCDQF